MSAGDCLQADSLPPDRQAVTMKGKLVTVTTSPGTRLSM